MMPLIEHSTHQIRFEVNPGFAGKNIFFRMGSARPIPIFNEHIDELIKFLEESWMGKAFLTCWAIDTMDFYVFKGKISITMGSISFSLSEKGKVKSIEILKSVVNKPDTNISFVSNFRFEVTLNWNKDGEDLMMRDRTEK